MKDISDLVSVLSKLPGIGKKSATRISYFLINNKIVSQEIISTLDELLKNIVQCSLCGSFTIQNPCKICSNNNRDKSILCIVEDQNDMIAIEETSHFNGLYHILMGAINPIEGKGPEKLRIKELFERLDNNSEIKEILIATNPTIEGESTFLYLQNKLANKNLKISRIATGIPMGGSLEYADKLTLSKAIMSKNYFQ